MSISGLIIFLVISGFAGWLASKILSSKRFGILGNIIVGIVGAILGGFVFNLLGFTASAGGLLSAFVTALIGAIMLLYVIGLIKKA